MAAPLILRRGRPADVTAIRALTAAYVDQRRIVRRWPVEFYESVQEFEVAFNEGQLVGCGALHIMWEDLAEIRTMAVDPAFHGLGVGHQILTGLLRRARDLGLKRVFCLTFEVEFFARHGFRPITGTPVSPAVYQEMLRSHDVGVAEFLDLARVKPNTLGNTRMLLEIVPDSKLCP